MDPPLCGRHLRAETIICRPPAPESRRTWRRPWNAASTATPRRSRRCDGIGACARACTDAGVGTARDQSRKMHGLEKLIKSAYNRLLSVSQPLELEIHDSNEFTFQINSRLLFGEEGGSQAS